MTISIVEN